jgi:hypothetical protein
VRIAAPSQRERLIRVRSRGSEERETREVSMGFIRSLMKIVRVWRWRMARERPLPHDMGLGETETTKGEGGVAGPTCR